MHSRVENLPINTTAQVFLVGNIRIPSTLWIRPTSGNVPVVEYSTDNGTNYQLLTALTSKTVYTETQVNAGFSNIRITSSGIQGGTWGIS